MKVATVFVAALATSALLGARAPALAPVTVDDLMGIRSIVDLKISPAGDRVAYVVSTPSLSANEHQPALFVVPVTGGSPERLAADARILNTPLPAPRLRWSPDGKTLAFLALSEAGPQVFATSPAGGSSRQLTSAPDGVFGFEWSPDGRSLAYLTREPMSSEEAQQRKAQSFVIRAGAPERPTRLAVQALASDASGAQGGPPARLLTPLTHYVGGFSWSPDSREIAYSAAPMSGFTSIYSTRIYAVPAAGGPPRVIVDRGGMNMGPQFSPDGTLISFITTSERTGLIAPRVLAVAPAAGGDPSKIRAFSLDGAWVGDVEWAPDSGAVYAVFAEGTFARRDHMFEQPVIRLRIEDGRAEPVVSGPTVNYSLSLSSNGATLAYRSVGLRNTGDVFVLDTASGQTRKLTSVNPELEKMALGEMKAISWRSFDGQEIWGLLLTPPGWSSGRLPLLVYCHGGPIGGFSYGLFPQFMHSIGQVDPYPVEAMASAGYAVLFPMPRGGFGYGEEGQRAIINSWGETDYKDIMTGVDHLIAQGIADPDRLGVMGASYGGFMTNWIVTQTGRFKAALSGASITDLDDMYYLPDGGELMIEYFKRPWEARESYAAHSPLTHVEKVTTPLLLHHGERDPRVPIEGAQKFYKALKALGKTVELDTYPRGGHVLYEPVLEREQWRRSLEWFGKWIEARSPAPEAR